MIDSGVLNAGLYSSQHTGPEYDFCYESVRESFFDDIGGNFFEKAKKNAPNSDIERIKTLISENKKEIAIMAACATAMIVISVTLYKRGKKKEAERLRAEAEKMRKEAQRMKEERQKREEEFKRRYRSFKEAQREYDEAEKRRKEWKEERKWWEERAKEARKKSEEAKKKKEESKETSGVDNEAERARKRKAYEAWKRRYDKLKEKQEYYDSHANDPNLSEEVRRQNAQYGADNRKAWDKVKAQKYKYAEFDW